MRARKPSDPGSGRSSGRRGLAVLVATAAAFLVIGVAQAAALPIIHFHGAGSGSGEMANAELGVLEGNPPIGCSYASPGPETGSCDPEAEEFSGLKAVAVEPVAAPGSEFVGWINKVNVSISSGECGPNCDIVNVVAGEPKEVTALFCLEGQSEEECLPPNLKVNIEEGSGSVVSSPAGIVCPSTCHATLAEGPVTLTASPAPGYIFKSWKKCDSGGVNGRQCTVTANETLKEVGAKFIPVWALTISKAEGSGTGSAKTKPGGIVCGYNCTTSTAVFKEGKPVEIVATPYKHFHLVEFKNGTGQAAACNGNTTCSYEPSGENSSTKVLFAEDTKYALSLAKTGGGQALIKTKPTGIVCGYTCGGAKAEYYEGEELEVSVKLNKGTNSLKWTFGAGTCTGTIVTTEATCTVTMSSAKELVAELQ